MSRQYRVATLAALLFALLFLIDTLRATEPFDLINSLADMLETALLVGGVVLTAYVSLESRTLQNERLGLMTNLDTALQDGAQWREAAQAHVTGLSRAIAAPFRTWGLTEAEADVAALMLKGLSHKEIAMLRMGSETTVRQHATAVYRKSHLSGRAQLTAFFLEDLLSPGTEQPASQASPATARLLTMATPRPPAR